MLRELRYGAHSDKSFFLCTHTTKDVVTQTEQLQEHARIQVSGCRACQSPALLSEGSRELSCVRCHQVGDVLSLVAEMRDEVERLKGIRDSEEEIYWRNCTLPRLGQMHLPSTSQEAMDLPPSQQQAKEGDLRNGGEGMEEVSDWAGRQIPCKGGKRCA